MKWNSKKPVTQLIYNVLMKPSTRLQNLPVSATRKLLPYAVEAKKNGVKIYHLNIGDPDIKTPEVMLNVLRHWQDNPIRYAASTGEPAYVEALEKYYHSIGHSLIHKKDIIATIGGSEAVFMSLFAVTNPGDEVIVFEPFYSGYLPWASALGIKLVAVSTDISSGFHLPDREVIEAKITPKTKAILFCTPSNPTGTVYTRQEMEMLVTIAKEKDLFLVSDEVYREFIYTDAKHTSILDFMHELPDKTILIDSLSKRYSLCGARLGTFISLNTELINGVTKLAHARLSGGFIDQTMASKSTEVPQSYTDEIREEYKRRRDLIYTELSKIPGVTIARPEGAFYSMVSLPVEDAEQFCIWLLSEFRDNNETVMFAAGSGFYITPGGGKNEVRLAYVLDREKLTRAIEILKKALTEYNK